METEKKYQGYGYHGGGRPRKSENGRVHLQLSYTEEQKEEIKNLAAELNVTVSQLVLDAIDEYKKSRQRNTPPA